MGEGVTSTELPFDYATIVENVIIDSEAMSSGITVTYNDVVIKIKQGLEVSSFISDNYSITDTAVINGTIYDVYTK